MDALIDPVTRDYRYTAGSFERDASGGLMNACYIRLMTPLGSWWRNPSLGSRLHELAREKDLARVALLAQQYAERALQPIVDDGRAQSIDMRTQQNFDGRLLLGIAVTARSGEVLTFDYLVKVI